MSNSKYTPGPWVINTENDITTQDGADIICNVDIGLTAYRPNAHLIAAAPEMLEALIFIISDENSILDSEARIILERVIAKAKGGSK